MDEPVIAILLAAGLLICVLVLKARPRRPPADRKIIDDAARKRAYDAAQKSGQADSAAPTRKPTQVPDNFTPIAQGSGAKRHDPKVQHAPPPPLPECMTLTGAAWVIDGDTIAINRIKIRLAGIDAPELDRPYGQKSKWAMVKLCKGQRIHVKLTGETSYDRLVGTCYLPDGRDLGAEIIKEGLALDGGYYSKGKYRHLEPAGIRRRLRPYGNR